MTARPRLSVRLHGGMPSGDCLDIAQRAERHGFDGVWFAENLFGRGILPIIGACAQATSRIAICVGVFNPFNRHPTLIAMEAASLDELAGGRVILGLGAGVKGLLEQAGISHDKPLAGMRDAFCIVRSMLAGEAATYSGRIFSTKGVKLGFAPLRRQMPVYMAAMGDQSLRLAGEMADGILISNMSPPGYTARARQIAGEGAAKAGRDCPTNIVQYVSCVCGADGAEARRVLADAISEFLVRYWNLKDRTPLIGEAMMRNSGIPEADFASAVSQLAKGAPASDVLDERFLDAYGIGGTAEECLAAIARFTEVGVTELVLTFAGKTPGESMALLGDAIHPAG
jgi:5,10-methylenetetrahydromethanopterin reductase